MQNLESTISYKGKLQELLRTSVYEQGKFEEYLQIPSAVKRMAAISSTTEIPYIRVAHKNLGLLLDLIGLSVAEMFEKVGEPIVLNDADKAALDAFGMLSDETIDRLIDALRAGDLSEPWWADVDGQVYPAKRYRTAATRRLAPTLRKEAAGVLTAEEIKIFQQPFRALPLEAVPHLATVLDVSSRWLMCIDENYPIFTARAKVDTLFDLYKLQNSAVRQILMKFVSAKTEVSA